ncbi:MAG: serine/threonine protein kinase [Planctomycetota bacterium]|nr:MAG: serine/threonine protein kinase [Planctomycetota bacterium]
METNRGVPKTDAGGSPRLTSPTNLEALGFGFEDESWLAALREAETPLPLGSIGPYELLGEISRGGQGVVFQARQPGTRRKIALKRPLAGALSSAGARLRFEQEIEAAAALNHPNIVTVYGMEIVDGSPVYAMEWVEGRPITAWANPSSAAGTEPAVEELHRDPREKLEVFLRVCDAIQHAHARGVLHRDLKPSNILVDASGQPHVLDFGLAKRTEPAERTEFYGLTTASGFLGTPAYASPEQLAGGAVLDARTDVYSLGVLLYELLAGRHPFCEKKGVAAFMRAVETETPVRPSTFDLRLDREVDTIAGKAMAKDRDRRYSTVEALARDLRSYLAGEPIEALPPSSWYLLRKLIQRNRLASVLLALIFLITMSSAIWSTIQSKRLKSALAEAEFRNSLYEKMKGWSPDSILKRADINPYDPRRRQEPPRNPPTPEIVD